MDTATEKVSSNVSVVFLIILDAKPAQKFALKIRQNVTSPANSKSTDELLSYEEPANVQISISPCLLLLLTNNVLGISPLLVMQESNLEGRRLCLLIRLKISGRESLRELQNLYLPLSIVSPAPRCILLLQIEDTEGLFKMMTRLLRS
jgi:hypothetical protein